MRRFWQACLAVVVTAAMANAADAQWQEPSEIGSYQSILSRSGYGTQGANGGASNNYSNQAAPIPPQPVMAGPGCSSGDRGFGMPSTDGGCGGICGSPNCGGPALGNRGSVGCGQGATGNCGSGSYLNYGSGGAGCNAPVYDARGSVAGGIADQASGSNANWVVGSYGMSFRRDYEDNIRLGYNGAGTDLYTRDVENGNMTGGGLSIARRNCDGAGFEAIFWGFDEEDDLTLAGPTYTYMAGLGNVAHPPSGVAVVDIFNAGDSVRLYRDTDITNFEFNLLRNGGEYKTRTGRCANYELLFGFRLFNFDESLRYVNCSSAPGYPTKLEYSLEAENSLAGFQFGGRSEICLTNRFRLAYGGTGGVYNNYIETRQQIFDNTGYWALDYSDTKNDAAFLGQLDVGLVYQFSCNGRARVGYRALGVSGVALAADQIPLDFTNTRALSSANSNGELLLYGFYYGGEFCF